MTPEEQTLLQAELANNPALQGRAASLVQRNLTAAGSSVVETWVVADSERRILKSLLLSYISIANLAAFSDWLETNISDTAKAFRLFWYANDEFDMTNDRARLLVGFLASQELISVDEQVEILRMGEVLQSRSQELFGRQLSLEEVEEVLS